MPVGVAAVGSGRARLILGVPDVDVAGGVDVPAGVWRTLRGLLAATPPGPGVDLVVHGRVAGGVVPGGWSIGQRRLGGSGGADVRVVEVDPDLVEDGGLVQGRARVDPLDRGRVQIWVTGRNADPFVAQWQLANAYRAVLRAAELPAAAAVAGREATGGGVVAIPLLGLNAGWTEQESRQIAARVLASTATTLAGIAPDDPGVLTAIGPTDRYDRHWRRAACVARYGQTGRPAAGR